MDATNEVIADCRLPIGDSGRPLLHEKALEESAIKNDNRQIGRCNVVVANIAADDLGHE